MERKRVPGYITKQASNQFGLDVKVQRQVYPKSDFSPSGDPVPEGQTPDGISLESDVRFRNVIPPGVIGSSEGNDLDVLTPPQYIDTVAYQPGEQNAPNLHNSVNQFKAANPDSPGIPFQDYASFTPRRAPMPRTAGDELYLPGAGKNVADPRMSNRDALEGLQDNETPDRAKLYGDNRDGVLRND